jgi:hypothetical protein
MTTDARKNMKQRNSSLPYSGTHGIGCTPAVLGMGPNVLRAGAAGVEAKGRTQLCLLEGSSSLPRLLAGELGREDCFVPMPSIS